MSNLKIVITDADTVFDKDISASIFNRFGELTVWGLTSYDETLERIKDADIVLCNKTRFDENILNNAPNLKYIGLFATGYNNVDIPCALKNGITVCNVPGYSTDSVAQHTFAFILGILNRVGEYNETVKQGDWIKSRTFTYFPLPLSELAGKTIGIVGYGAIGRRVGSIARAFGMNVLVVNRSTINDPAVNQVSFNELLEKSDIVTMHCPLNADSDTIMNASAFSKMKRGSIFVNTARGGLVDERALRAALDAGHLLGAGIDVLRSEPMSADCPLFGAPNCLITPHIAWAGVDTRKRLIDIVCSNVKAFINGAPVNTITE